MLAQVEREEQYVTKTLQKQLDQVPFAARLARRRPLKHRATQLRAEKIQLELTLEREQEFAVNRLRRQLQQLQSQQPCVAPAVAAGPSS